MAQTTYAEATLATDLAAAFEEHRIEVRDPVEVAEFLAEYPPTLPRLVPDLVVEAAAAIRRCWGAEQPLALVVAWGEPEVEEPGYLFLKILTTRSWEEERSRYRTFDHGEWRAFSKRGKGRLNFNLEFV